MRTKLISLIIIFLSAGSVLLLSPLVNSTAEAKSRAGAVIETVEPGSGGEKAGVKPGDLFLT